MKKLLALILALSLCFSLVACGGDKQQEDAAADQPSAEAKPTTTQTTVENNQQQITEADKTVEYEEWVYGSWTGKVNSFDPYGDTTSTRQAFCNMTHEPLNYLDADTGKLMPMLAYKWEPNADKTEWTIYLEEGVKFHNGNDFTADDVKFTWEWAGQGQGNVAKPIPGFTYVKEIVVVDDYTVKFVLNSAMPDFDTYLEQPIIDKEIYEELDYAIEASWNGTGPYYYDDALTKLGELYVATRNDNYWGGIDNYPTIHQAWKIVPDLNAMTAAFENREIDYAAVEVSQYITLKDKPGLKMYTRPGAQSFYIGFNYANEALQNLEVRKALGQAINKEDVVAIVYHDGLGGVANGNFCTPNGLGYTPDTTPIPYDKEAAKAILEPLGLELTMISNKNNLVIGEVIQQHYKEVGVTLNLRVVTDNWTAVKASQEGYDLFVDYCAYQGALMHNYHRFFADGGSSNVYGYFDEEYEKLDAAVSTAPTYEDMLKEFATLQQWVIDNVPIFPLSIKNMLGCSQDDVEGLYFAPTNNYHNFATVRIPKRG